MSTATDFVSYRNYYLQTKKAGWQDVLAQVGQIAAAHPIATGVVGGGALGGLSGLLPGQSVVRNALIGAGLGGVGGGAYQYLNGAGAGDQTPPGAPPVSPPGGKSPIDDKQREILDVIGLGAGDKQSPTEKQIGTAQAFTAKPAPAFSWENPSALAPAKAPAAPKAEPATPAEGTDPKAEKPKAPAKPNDKESAFLSNAWVNA